MARELFEDKSRAMNMGFVYSGSEIEIQPGASDMFNGMEMIGFSKRQQAPPMIEAWKALFAKNHNIPKNNNNVVGVDESSLRCVFPCEGNERPSQGLSLSLSSTNPSGIGLQSFELRNDMRTDGFNLRTSKYLAPAQDLLNEFCSLETTPHNKSSQQQKSKLLLDDNNGNGSSSSSSRNKHHLHSPSSSSLYSLDVLDLHNRKAKLLSMLQQVDMRYRHYSEQMKAVESVLESAAGAGSATVYSALASKAMSRHFRCLRDGIVGQIQSTKKAIGEKDPVASRGETPRLRVLDQTLRQQRAFQQMTMMESHPWRPQRGLPERSVSVLRAWLFEHFLHPYPSDVDKHILARQTGLSRSQVSNWFINARVRLWKPMVEEMYVEETKEEEDNVNSNLNMGGGGSSDGVTTSDHKPTPDQLVRIDSDCLSSIITNPNPDKDSKTNNNFNYNTTSYGAMDLDFASYNNINFNSNGTGTGNGVSLTLGLQHHNNAQGSMFYNPRSTVHHQEMDMDMDMDMDMEMEMDMMEPVVHYTMMDGQPQNNLPYRNLMGAQLLHDLPG